MKKIFSLILCVVLIPTTLFAKPESNETPTFCSLEALKNDKVLSTKLNMSKDPAGLAIESTTPDTNVGELLQHYVNEHQCTLSLMSMGDLVAGLFKGSQNSLASTNGTSNDLQKMGQKYLLIEGDKSICIKKLGLHLPVKTYIPVVVKFCSLNALKTDKNLTHNLKFSHDPAGLAVEAKSEQVDADSIFKKYANDHGCVLYVLSMKELMSGLLKGSVNGANPPATPSKYLLIDGDKAVCIKKLGFDLPLKAYPSN